MLIVYVKTSRWLPLSAGKRHGPKQKATKRRVVSTLEVKSTTLIQTNSNIKKGKNDNLKTKKGGS